MNDEILQFTAQHFGVKPESLSARTRPYRDLCADDRQMETLADFDVTVTFCFTPEHRGLEPHHTSPPQVAEEFADFCAEMTARYAPARPQAAAISPARLIA